MPPLYHNCLVLYCLITLLAGKGLAQHQFPPTKRYEFGHRQMGTLFRLVLYAPDSVLAREAADKAFRRIDTLNAILSDYQPGSELNRLSASAGTNTAIAVSKDLLRVLAISRQASLKSKGAFDVTVGPNVRLWRRSVRQQTLPSAKALNQALHSTGYQHVQIDQKRSLVTLTKPGMQLDAGGIGKGYAVDEAMKVLQQSGIRSALVDGGGNITVSEPPPGRMGWEIKLKTAQQELPARDHPPAPPPTLSLNHAAISTSGDLYQYLELEDGQGNLRRYSHILDPRTGLGVTNQYQTTVVAANATTADWLSTAVCVLGPEQGLRLVDRTPGAAARMIRKKGSTLAQWESKRWREVKSQEKILQQENAPTEN